MKKRRGWLYFVIAVALILVGLRMRTAHQAHAAGQAPGPGAELVQNGGFEDGGDPAPRGWFRDMKQTGKKGQVRQDTSKFHSGHASVRLQPNDKNGGDQPLAIAQVIPGGAYRGQKVIFSGYLATEGGAAANLGMLTIVGGRAENLQIMPATGDWSHQSKVYDVPNDPSVQLVITCFVNGNSGSAWFDDISVVPYSPSSENEPQPNAPAGAPAAVQGAAMNAKVEVDASHVIRQIPTTLFGTNIEWRWNANFLWQEAQKRPDPEILRLTKELGVTLIRYPGGIYSDYYHWKQGIGPLDQRPIVKHEGGSDDKSRLNFGTDEALKFAQDVGAELLITVNAGSGTPEEAAEWVRYVNGKELRVKYWEVGNEIYIKEGPTSKPITMDPGTYAAKFVKFAQAMKAADSRIKIGAVGGENYGRYQVVAYSDWNKTVLQRAGQYMDFLAVHNSYAPVLSTDQDLDVRSTYKAMLAAPVLEKQNLETISQQIAQYVPARASQIFVAVTEWGPFFQLDFKGRYVDHPKTLGSALFVASAMKNFIESPKTNIANFWFLNDFSVLGWIGSRSTKFPPEPDWLPTPRYYAFQLYRHHFGTQLVSSSETGPTFNSPPAGWIDSVNGAPYLDVVSSLSADGNQLYIMAINKSFDSSMEATIDVKGFRPSAQATAWTLNGTGIDANTGTRIVNIPGFAFGKPAEDERNARFSRGNPSEVSLTSSPVKVAGPSFTYRYPAHSVTSLTLTRAGR